MWELKHDNVVESYVARIIPTNKLKIIEQIKYNNRNIKDYIHSNKHLEGRISNNKKDMSVFKSKNDLMLKLLGKFDCPTTDMFDKKCKDALSLLNITINDIQILNGKYVFVVTANDFCTIKEHNIELDMSVLYPIGYFQIYFYQGSDSPYFRNILQDELRTKKATTIIPNTIHPHIGSSRHGGSSGRYIGNFIDKYRDKTWNSNFCYGDDNPVASKIYNSFRGSQNIDTAFKHILRYMSLFISKMNVSGSPFTHPGGLADFLTNIPLLKNNKCGICRGISNHNNVRSSIVNYIGVHLNCHDLITRLCTSSLLCNACRCDINKDDNKKRYMAFFVGGNKQPVCYNCAKTFVSERYKLYSETYKELEVIHGVPTPLTVYLERGIISMTDLLSVNYVQVDEKCDVRVYDFTDEIIPKEPTTKTKAKKKKKEPKKEDQPIVIHTDVIDWGNCEDCSDIELLNDDELLAMAGDYNANNIEPVPVTRSPTLIADIMPVHQFELLRDRNGNLVNPLYPGWDIDSYTEYYAWFNTHWLDELERIDRNNEGLYPENEEYIFYPIISEEYQAYLDEFDDNNDDDEF